MAQVLDSSAAFEWVRLALAKQAESVTVTRTCETTGRVQDAGWDAFVTQDGAVCLHMMRRRRARRKMGKHSCAEMLPILRLKLAEMFAFGNRP